MDIRVFSFENKNSMGIMEVFKNPNKKPRLDLRSQYEGTVANDDLWGDDGDLTAEEFDMLEVQATQGSHQINHSSSAFHQPFRNVVNERVPSLQTEEMKQHQYELEGKIKLLSDSLEKLSKELNEEKLSKEKLVSKKLQEFQEKESIFRKEIQKLQSALQFKDQEMKTIYEKVHGLEASLQEKATPMPDSKQSPKKFLEKFQFQNPPARNVQECKSLRPCRKNKLLVDTPQGKTAGSDIVSSILCNRLALSSSSSPYFTPLSSNQFPVEQGERTSAQLSAVSIARIGSNQQTEELFDYFISVLTNHLSQLKTLSSAAVVSAKSPLSIRRKDLNHERVTVISCLKDMCNIISCPQFSSLLKWTEGRSAAPNPKFSEQTGESVLFIDCDKRTRCKNKFKSLLQLLICLINPDTYPAGLTLNDDIEWSLAVLVSWSSSAPENFIGFVDEIPVPLLTKCIHSVTYSYMSLKLIMNLCIAKEFIPIMIHKNDACLLCSIAEFLLQKVSSSVLQFANIMLLIENFFSTVFTVHSFSELNLDSSPCSSLILQGIVTSLWKFHEIHNVNKHEVMLVIKKGFSLVHLLSRYLPNFKARRTAFEDCYISLVCGMLTLSKENGIFKDFYDVVHDLWDFQEDTSEFDLEEPSDDSSQLMELSSKNDQ